MKFEVGQTWKTRYRGNVKITGIDKTSNYPVIVGKRSFDLNGNYWEVQHQSVWDLVELIPDQES